MGRRAHEPDQGTRRQVEAMAGFGVPESDIAGVLGIDPKTLRRHYRDELRHGHVKANARVAESLYRKATSDGAQSVTAAIFWLKTRAGWKETSVTELAARDQEPVLIVRTICDPKAEGFGSISPATEGRNRRVLTLGPEDVKVL
jgi:hypothetical protein